MDASLSGAAVFRIVHGSVEWAGSSPEGRPRLLGIQTAEDRLHSRGQTAEEGPVYWKNFHSFTGPGRPGRPGTRPLGQGRPSGGRAGPAHSIGSCHRTGGVVVGLAVGPCGTHHPRQQAAAAGHRIRLHYPEPLCSGRRTVPFLVVRPRPLEQPLRIGVGFAIHSADTVDSAVCCEFGDEEHRNPFSETVNT